MLSVRSFQREGTQTISNAKMIAIVFLNYFWLVEICVGVYRAIDPFAGATNVKQCGY
jgi:hypothetical protein